MSLPESLQPFVIDAPATPSRVFAGVDPAAVTYLQFADQAEMQEAFEAAGFKLRPAVTQQLPGEPHEEIVTPAQTWADIPPDFLWPGVGDVSIIGAIVDQPAVIGPPGENGFPTIKTPATLLPGWHVNVLQPPAPSVLPVREPIDREPMPPEPPMSITPAQARLVLMSLDLLDKVNAAVAEGPPEMKIMWEYATEIRRDNPLLIGLARKFGIENQLPELFAHAATLG